MMLKQKRSVIEIILSAIALIVAVLIFAKAIFDLDSNYDVGWYHLPFAARIWNIISAESFRSEDVIEYRYEGFPLLAHFFQGLLWKLTGRIQATNLAGYLSLITYFLFLRSFFHVPLYISTIAIFTIPAVLAHASTSMIDLFGNVGASVVMMMIYRFFSCSRAPKANELIAITLGAIMAANTKPQLQPLIFVLYIVAGVRLLWLYFKHIPADKRRLWSVVPLAAIASVLIFATPIKNVAFYGNPFYPIKIEVAGVVLNHKLTPETYSEGNRAQKWLQSILEINTPVWSVDQWNQGNEKLLDRAGGFFGAYVIFNLLLLLCLTVREQLQRQASEDKSRRATTALLTILLVSLIPANFPQSHELRYFMFWMITLVSLNLHIVASLSNQTPKWLQIKYISLIYLIFAVIAWSKINRYYLGPVFRPLDKFLANNIKTELVEQMLPDEDNCLIARHAVANLKRVSFASIKNAFYYSSYFHPEVGYDYSIKAAIEPKQCGGSHEVPPNVPNLPEP